MDKMTWRQDHFAMTMRILNTLLFLWMTVGAFGQAIPYDIVKTIDDCAKELRQVEGCTAEVAIKHADPKDNRDFQLLLETSKDRKPIKLNKDGTFRLPTVKADEVRKAQVIHSLEKGALSLDFYFGWQAKPPTNASSETSLSEFCSFAANKFGIMEHTFIRLGDVLPSFKDLQITFVGVSLPRDTPSSGLALLKNGEKTVASVDLSQTGKVSWMFADYDPKTHWIEFEMKDGAAEPNLSMEIRTDKEAAESEGAILVRKRR